MDSSQLEQFLILGKSSKSKALEAIIDQVLAHKQIYVFNEFLQLPNVQELKGSSKHFATLDVFAYGTFMDYKQNKDNMIELSGFKERKIKMITIAELASKNKTLHYDNLMKLLDINNVRELEDTIIECMYNNLIKGKLDQKNKKLVVFYNYGRDVRPSDIPDLIGKLENWNKLIGETETLIGKQITGCNKSMEQNQLDEAKFDEEIIALKDKLIKQITRQNEMGAFEMMSGMMGRGGNRGKGGGGGGMFQGFKPGFLK